MPPLRIPAFRFQMHIHMPKHLPHFSNVYLKYDLPHVMIKNMTCSLLLDVFEGSFDAQFTYEKSC